ncbi:MAG: helix-turn-helix transcriptional regulator [Alphaproteobacteria bacterium]|nr:helix-turn-helix transcriptional regulator [Alphaproteobacteria bacterium]
MKPDRLHDMRRRAGLTQAELAARLDVSQGTISNVERGERALGLSLAQRWPAGGRSASLSRPTRTCCEGSSRGTLAASWQRLSPWQAWHLPPGSCCSRPRTRL